MAKELVASEREKIAGVRQLDRERVKREKINWRRHGSYYIYCTAGDIFYFQRMRENLGRVVKVIAGVVVIVARSPFNYGRN